ncbi:DNA/RNA non-specific endonuclease [Rhodococcus kroppenstedtii]|uniref:DNA/RNA non-specific endonuclease n=1 Tax=Rhodococcoides kroppenstedtii TaxID=293050 RepID=UPI00295375AA|nr:DNA/RNA non-specific endonuclease [Rhodococcus kroppenstedtii]MDV7199094.1 DNA/RNA non-specific endonuclease [Rhodococcus kroppenstedtii]
MTYDASFLGTADALPIPSRDGLVILDYTHFAVSMDTRRRLAAVTAVNIDGSDLRDVERGDDWRLDPRLPETQQAGPELYSANDLDRGHLVRRRDPVWGENAERANADTFHYTVCAPQTATLNQSRTLWLGLEDYVLDHARQYGERLSVFTGCLFESGDPVYRGVSIPRRFFKVAAWAQEESLAATGYVLDQTASLGPILERGVRAADVPALGAYRTYQVPIADIAAATHLVMPLLVDADRLAPVPAARPTPWIELTGPEDLRLER